MARQEAAAPSSASSIVNRHLDVLLLSAGYGNGHHQAARAIVESMQALWPQCRYQILDYLEYFPRFIEWSTVGLYKVMTRHTRVLYASVYHLTSAIAGMWGWSQVEYSIGRRQLREMIQQTQPAAIVCTHALPMAVLSTMRKRGEKLPPIFAVITDYVLHKEWVQPQLNRYYVPTEHIRELLIRHGLEPERISVSGIPVRRAFFDASKTAVNHAHQHSNKVPIVLFIGSTIGTLSRVAEACTTLLDIPDDFKLVVVCGYDESLVLELQSLSATHPQGERLQVLGFVENIAELMRSADVVITKAGGITLSEALALRRPLVLYRPIPGQEAGNSRFVADQGAGVIAKTPETLQELITGLLRSKSMRLVLASEAMKISHPNSASVIASDILETVLTVRSPS